MVFRDGDLHLLGDLVESILVQDINSNEMVSRGQPTGLIGGLFIALPAGMGSLTESIVTMTVAIIDVCKVEPALWPSWEGDMLLLSGLLLQ